MAGNDPRARLEELRQRKRYNELKAKADGGQKGAEPAPESGGVGNFVKSLTEGSSLGENMPGGKMLAELGTKAGAGIAAATKAPFSDKPIGQLYDESLAPSLAKRERESAADQASPSGRFLKSSLAALPLGAMKAAQAAAPAGAMAAETTAAAPVATEAAKATGKGWLSGSSSAGGEAAASAAAKAPGKGWLSGSSTAGSAAGKAAEEITAAGAATSPEKEKLMAYYMKKYGPEVLEQGIEMLPYPIRAPLRAVMRIRKAGAKK